VSEEPATSPWAKPDDAVARRGAREPLTRGRASGRKCETKTGVLECMTTDLVAPRKARTIHAGWRRASVARSPTSLKVWSEPALLYYRASNLILSASLVLSRRRLLPQPLLSQVIVVARFLARLGAYSWQRRRRRLRGA
jgi:hypothetical protein